MMLFPGHYRCQNCGRDVDRVQKERRFWICDNCYREIVEPTAPDVVVKEYDSDERRARSRYWEWIGEMNGRYPVGRNWRPVIKPYEPPDIGAFWPFCRSCGAEVAEYEFSTKRSLFGRHRATYCPTCEAKRTVESVIRMAPKIHPEFDDEDWLDLLWKSHREAFEIGVLPDYWFEMKRKTEIER